MVNIPADLIENLTRVAGDDVLSDKGDGKENRGGARRSRGS